MNLLLDTATFIWLAEADPALSRAARGLIANPDNRVLLSSASAWEIAIKHGLGRLELAMPPAEYVPMQRRVHRIATLAISESAALQVEKLPSLHRDPFDRLLVAQAIVEGLAIVTPDRAIRAYPVQTVW